MGPCQTGKTIPGAGARLKLCVKEFALICQIVGLARWRLDAKKKRKLILCLSQEAVLTEQQEVTDAIGRSKVLDLELAGLVLMGLANAGTPNKGQSQRQREIVGDAVGLQQRVRLDGSEIVHMIFFRRSGRQVRGGLCKGLIAQPIQRLVVECDHGDAVPLLDRCGGYGDDGAGGERIARATGVVSRG